MLDIIILGIGQQSIAILIGLPGVVRVAVGPLPLEIRYSTVPSTGYLTNTFWSLQPNRIRQKIPLTPFFEVPQCPDSGHWGTPQNGGGIF